MIPTKTAAADGTRKPIKAAKDKDWYHRSFNNDLAFAAVMVVFALAVAIGVVCFTK